MSADSLIFWLFVVAWVVVGALIFMQVPRAIAEVLGIVRHIRVLTELSPLPLLLSKAESDLRRIEAAVGCVPILQERVEAALVVIRTTPLVPPQIAELVLRVRREIAAFRRAS